MIAEYYTNLQKYLNVYIIIKTDEGKGDHELNLNNVWVMNLSTNKSTLPRLETWLISES
jgi:hypothetical protein